MTKILGIAGMGWLGLPLAQRLQYEGYQVKGTVTQSQKVNALKELGLEVYPMVVTERGVLGAVQSFLKDVSLLVVMIPPGLRRNTGSDYVLKMSYLLEEIGRAGTPRCIFISSTSVYGDAQGEVTEAHPPKPDTEAGRQLLQVEQLFFNSDFEATIVRFGGLLGGSRQPVRYLAGRKNLSGGDAPVNLIHREDCIGILLRIIKQGLFGHIFNAVYPAHPPKKIYYAEKALAMGLEAPSYSPEGLQVYKEVHSVNVPEILDYPFQKEI
ncbi:MAG TPA: NAD(P)H-binding protein [Flavobacteriaceae bacterium]|nr:NAD(P)H-binding protein [Flavobacteriaceae bacterium]MCB9212087.1 NAD(P)H-binding protein [Alteromonas sp.]HPF09817.1 NAD(P)H-binding protein [Flavobacteriaceae bacterium]HQU22021.1 NAD(P)H-binding protein [Flavobacteriaceae bacterium]HQU64098.1 NAD(P)H-binding protein [Flavobacteriaceae bacterium]